MYFRWWVTTCIWHVIPSGHDADEAIIMWVYRSLAGLVKTFQNISMFGHTTLFSYYYFLNTFNRNTNDRVFFSTCKNWSSIKSFKIKRSRSNLLHIVVVWSLRFCNVTSLSFKCGMPGFLVLHSRTEMPKLIKIAKMLLKHRLF